MRETGKAGQGFEILKGVRFPREAAITRILAALLVALFAGGALGQAIRRVPTG